MKRTQLRPVLNQGKAIAERVKEWGIIRSYKTRRSLRRTFAKKRNQRKAIYIGSAILIVSLAVGWSAYHDNAVAIQQNLEQNLKMKEVESQQRATKLNTLQNDLQGVQKQKADTEAQLKAKADQETQLKQQIDDLNAKLQAKLENQKVTVASAQGRPSSAVSNGGNCATWMAAAGITHPIAIDLIGRESGCNPCSYNPSSSDCNYAGDRACGIPQALPCSKLRNACQPWTDAVCQLRWMQNYVIGRYGSWEGAKAHHDSYNWY